MLQRHRLYAPRLKFGCASHMHGKRVHSLEINIEREMAVRAAAMEPNIIGRERAKIRRTAQQ